MDGKATPEYDPPFAPDEDSSSTTVSSSADSVDHLDYLDLG